MTDNPLVSVIIPTYNRVGKIGAAIESVFKQTYENVQLIVSDDGSTDGTESFIKSKYAAVDYVLGTHGGQASARNKGLSISNGTIIASLDSDDEWDPEFLEHCVAKLESDNLDFVFTNWHQQDVNGNYSDFLGRDPYLRPYVRDGVEWQQLSPGELRSLYLKECASPSSSAVLRKSSIVSGWNERMKVGDDWCLYLDIILSKNCHAAFTMDKLWHKHINYNNVYDGRKRNELLEFFYIADTIEIMDRFQSRLTREELAYLNKKCTRAFVELAKHHMLRDFNPGKSMKLIGRSIQLSLRDTLVAIPDVVFFGMDRHFKDLWGKLLKKGYADS